MFTYLFRSVSAFSPLQERNHSGITQIYQKGIDEVSVKFQQRVGQVSPFTTIDTFFSVFIKKEPLFTKILWDGIMTKTFVLFHQNMQKVGIVSEKGSFNIFGVEFVPFCSRMFFRGEMNGIYASPEELRDEELVVLSQRIHETVGTEDRVVQLDDFFMKRLSEFPEGDVNIERLNNVFGDMVPTDGNATGCQEQFSTADLASTACLSQKQFTRIFSKYVGMNPKSYLRLLRFHKALMMLQSEASSPSGDNRMNIAWQCGYLRPCSHDIRFS